MTAARPNCPACYGTGRVMDDDPRYDLSAPGTPAPTIDCPECSGGQWYEQRVTRPARSDAVALAERHYAVALTAYRATLRHLADPGPDGDRRSDHPTDRFYRQMEASD